MVLKKGERFNLSKNGLLNFKVKIEWSCKDCEIDSTIFLLQDGKSSDENIVFFNNPLGINGSVKLNDEVEYKEIDFNLERVAKEIDSIIIALTIEKPQKFGDISNLSMNITGATNITYNLDKFSNETAITLLEIYKKSGEWRLKTVGTGFISGLETICKSFGIEVDKQEEEIKPIEEKKIKELKIDLKKYGEKAKISLEKDTKIEARLFWKTNADLDLYCFYVEKNNIEDKVYYKKLGDLDNRPYIRLMGDSKNAGEEIIVFSKPKELKYALICAYSAMSNGVGSFFSYKAKVAVTDGKNQSVITHLSHKDPFSYWVALAFIDFSQEGEATIKNIETYANKKTFKEQFKLKTGTEPKSFFHNTTATVNGINTYNGEASPYLFKDGTFMMSVGEIEFK